MYCVKCIKISIVNKFLGQKKCMYQRGNKTLLTRALSGIIKFAQKGLTAIECSNENFALKWNKMGIFVESKVLAMTSTVRISS